MRWTTRLPEKKGWYVFSVACCSSHEKYPIPKLGFWDGAHWQVGDVYGMPPVNEGLWFYGPLTRPMDGMRRLRGRV